MLDDKMSRENVLLNKNALVFKQFSANNLGSYECSSENDSVLTRLQFILEKGLNNSVVARTKSYIVESINSQYNDLPQIRLDFVTPLENIKDNDKVEIRCSSSTGKIKIYFFKAKNYFYLDLFFLENTRIEWFQQNDPLFTDTLLSYNFTSNDLDLYKCVVVKFNIALSGKPQLASENSIGVRFKRKSDIFYDASIEHVDSISNNLDHLLEQFEMHDENDLLTNDLNSSQLVKITLKEPDNLNLVKLNSKVALECNLLLSDRKYFFQYLEN